MNTAANTVPQRDSSAWHAIAGDEVLRRLDSNVLFGLAADEAPRRLEKYGRNRLPEGRKQGPLMRFLMQFNYILVYVLLAAGFVKLMVGLWLDAAIILGVVVINAVLGFIQEGKADKAWTRFATCCPRRPEPCAAGRRAWSRPRN
jgi:magnesium-transporting ATPase (P-type)